MTFVASKLFTLATSFILCFSTVLTLEAISRLNSISVVACSCLSYQSLESDDS